MKPDMVERGFDGDYVCVPCKLIYKVYGSRHRCDICNRRLKFFNVEKVRRLEEKWEAEDKAKVLGGKG